MQLRNNKNYQLNQYIKNIYTGKFTFNVTETIFPTINDSDFRTSPFMGNRYDLELLSGNIDVFHDVLPIVTSTFTDPHPRRLLILEKNLISSAMSVGRVMKCHAALPL
jgi:hypothetical protein